MKREQVRVSVIDCEQYDGNWPTGEVWTSLLDTIAWFQEKLDEIPPEYREAANCEIDSTSGYEDSHYGHISIWYYRPETDDEMHDRTVRLDAERSHTKAQELAALRSLRAKYPDAT